MFAATAVLMGTLGVLEAAGHQVALHLAAFTFMVPMGISQAAAIRVGQAVGRGDMDAVRRAASAALWFGIVVMAAFAGLFLTLPDPLAHLWTDKIAVVAIAITLIPIAGVFQVFDGAQVVCIGILRGTGDTRTPVLTAIGGFWLIGFPVGWWLGLERGWGPAGLWWGLVAGLATVAVALGWRVRRRLDQDLTRIVVDRPVSPAPPTHRTSVSSEA